MNDSIRSETHDHVLRVTLNRPHKKNALTETMYRSLADALEESQANDDVHVVLLVGEGSFCAGNDLEEFAEHPTTLPLETMRFLRALAVAKKPIIAGVRDFAIGVGATMLLHCDLVYAERSARLAFPFTHLGLTPEAGASVLLGQAVGSKLAAEALLLGESMSATRALEIGLINRVVDDGTIDRFVLERAHRLASLPRTAVQETKRLIMARNRSDTLATIDEEARVFMDRLRSDEFAAAVAAFRSRKADE